MIKKTILRKSIFLLVGLLSCINLNAQDSSGCGCDYYGVDDCVNNTVIPGGEFLTICYEVTDLINSDLGVNQNICGIRVDFWHSLIWGLEINLTSPQGQSIELVGPALALEEILQYGTTPLSFWYVDFLPSTSNVSPDQGFNDQWSNSQEWKASTLYTGSYWPSDVNLNLEDLSGSANGQWCLEINNTVVDEGFVGSIMDFEVIFCDVGGLPCCYADAGDLQNNETDTSFCYSDNLDLDIYPIYIEGGPDTNYYAYQFLISDENGNIIGIEEDADLSNYPAGTYDVCGLSYLIEDEAYLDSILIDNFSIGVLEDTLFSENYFCGDLTNTCLTLTIETPNVLFDDTIILCEGTDTLIEGTIYDMPGNYEITFDNPSGCDDVGLLTIFVDSTDFVELSDTICFGDSFSINGTDFYTTSGFYTDTLPNLNGCDSIVELDLTVLEQNLDTLNEIICIGDALTVEDSIFTISGNYKVPIINENGCSDTLFVNLVVEDINALITTVNNQQVLNCSSPNVELDGAFSSGANLLNYQWSTVDGIIESPSDQITVDVSAAGVYQLIVSSDFGCSDTTIINILEDQNYPIIDVSDYGIINCIDQTIQLDASATVFVNNGIFEWSTNDGNILSPLDNSVIDVDAAGTYTLSITDTVNNCLSTESFLIGIDTIAPPLSGTDDIITCFEPSVPLALVGDYAGPYFWEWKREDGSAISGSQNMPVYFSVDTSGIYILEALNIDNGCITIDSVTIELDTISPIAILDPVGVLDCSNTTLLINGGNSSPLNNYGVSWSGPPGGIESGSGTLSVVVDEPGLYNMAFINLDNGCEDEASIEVLSNVEYESLDASADNMTLDCETTAIDLGLAETNPTEPNFDYSWTNLNDLIFNENGQMLTVTGPGIYVMSVLNQSNQCISTDTVVVESIQRNIEASTVFSNILTCSQPTTDLTGSYTEVLTADINTISFQWLDPSGIIIGNSATVTVDQGGIYQFIVFDNYSLCSDTIELEVQKNNELPSPDAGSDISLDCNEGTADLLGSYPDDPNTHISYWTTADGNILSSDEFSALVDEIGLYTFVVESTDGSGCIFEDDVLVYVDTILCTPVIDTIPDVVVDCYNIPEVFGEIDATDVFSQASQSSYLTYSWEVVDGIIDGTEDTLIIKALIGTYVFEVTNPTFGFTSRDTIELLDGRVYPNVEIAQDTLMVDCAQLEANVALVGSELNGLSSMIYTWEAEDESYIVSGINDSIVMINAPGLYSFIGVNSETACLDAATVFVGIDGTFPPSNCLPDNAQFDCDEPSIEISLDSCTSPDFEYFWSIETGAIESPNGDTTVEVSILNSPSYLVLEITDTTNSCSSLDSVLIFGEGQCFPECAINIPDVITCSQDSIQLDASNSSVGAEFIYEWSTDIGSFCGNIDELVTCVNSDGFYTLQITDQISGLSCSTSILVEDDYSTLNAIINPLDSINCYADSINISFSVLDDGPYTVSWITPDVDCAITEPFDGFYYTSCGGDYGLIISSEDTGCPDTFGFTIPMDTIRPSAGLTSNDILDCSNPSLGLLALGSSVGDDFYYYYYNSNGEVFEEGINLPFAVTTTAGEHALVVEDLRNGCQDTSLYQVIDNANIFDADAGTYPDLDCSNPSLELEGSANQLFNNLIYYWEGDVDCFVTDPNNQTVTINCPGLYTLVVLDTITGCDDVDFTAVEQDDNFPLADGGPDVTIECTDDFVVLDGSSSDIGVNINYEWYTLDGNIIGDNTIPSIEVDLEGTYYLFVEDTSANCVDTSIVQVNNGVTFPVANAGEDAIWGCETELVDLDGSNSTTGASYSWSTTDGSIASGINSLNPSVDAPGTYLLSVDENGCIDFDEVLVIEDDSAPVANILTFSNYINCVYDTLTLNGSDPSHLGLVDYLWTSDNTIIGDNENSSIQIIQPGIYFLELENPENGCTNSVSIEIFESYAEPNLVYELPEELNCFNELVTIDASSSISDNGILAELTGPANATIYNASTLIPTVDTAGLYQLIIRDAFSLCADTVLINVYENYEEPLLELGSDPNVLCEVNDAVLDLSTSVPFNQIDYSWFYNDVLILEGDSIIMTNDLGAYSVIGQSQITGCRDTMDIEVGAVGNPITDVLFSTEELDCYGDSDGALMVESVSGGTAPYLYKISDLEFGTYPQFLYLEAGDYLLEVEDVDGCKFEELVIIENPEALKVSLGDDQYIRYGELALIVADIEAINAVQKIEWGNLPSDFNNNLQVEVGPSNTSIYDILVVDSKSCEARDSVIIYVDETPGIFIPNTFNPIGDFANTIFGPLADESIALINTFKIYDRWGAKVFEDNNFQAASGNGWDGTFNGKKVQAGVYVWYLEASLANGELIYLKGSVALMR